jgi:hypothetical protein
MSNTFQRTLCYLVLLLTLIGCGQPAPHWTTADALRALDQAGLKVENVHIPDADGTMPGAAGVEAIQFHLPNTNQGALGTVFSLPSARDAQQLEASARTSFSQFPNTSTSAALAFTHDNLYVMLFGNTSEATLRTYQDAIERLK